MVASTRKRRLFLYAFVVVAFIALAWRNEILDGKTNALIAAQQERDHQDCLRRVDNVKRLNALYAGLVRIEQDNPFRFTSPKTVEDRIRLFTDAQLEPPTCTGGK